MQPPIGRSDDGGGGSSFGQKGEDEDKTRESESEDASDPSRQGGKGARSSTRPLCVIGQATHTNNDTQGRGCRVQAPRIDPSSQGLIGQQSTFAVVVQARVSALNKGGVGLCVGWEAWSRGWGPWCRLTLIYPRQDFQSQKSWISQWIDSSKSSWDSVIPCASCVPGPCPTPRPATTHCIQNGQTTGADFDHIISTKAEF